MMSPLVEVSTNMMITKLARILASTNDPKMMWSTCKKRLKTDGITINTYGGHRPDIRRTELEFTLAWAKIRLKC